MATFYGSDTDCIDDLPLIDLQVTNPKILIGQRVARRITTPRGALALVSDDGDFGFDVRQFLNGKISPDSRSIAQQQISNEVLKDEQVSEATVSVSSVESTRTMVIDIHLVTSAGPFDLTLDVRDLTVSLLFQGI